MAEPTLEHVMIELQAIRQRLDNLQGVAVDEWLPTSQAWGKLQRQGIASAQSLREHVQKGILVVDDEQVRDVSESPGRSTYEFNIPKCLERLAWYKTLPLEERLQIQKLHKQAQQREIAA